MGNSVLRLLLALLAVLSIAPVASAQDWLDPELQQRHTGRKIAEIKVKGNRKVESAAIREIIVSRKGQALTPLRVKQDIDNLWTKVKYFSDISVEVADGPGDSVVLTYVVQEKPSVRKIIVRGNDEVSIDDINGKIDNATNIKNKILDRSKIRKLQVKIEELYEEEGYYLAKVDYEIKSANEAEVDVVFLVKEGKEVSIRGVQFVGNEVVPDSELRGMIATREKDGLAFLSGSGKFKEGELSTDMSRLQAYYFDLGHILVNIGTPKIELSADRRHLYVSIPIDEGPVFDISKVTFTGDIDKQETKFRELLGTGKGETFSRTKIGTGIEKMTRFYKDRGFAHAAVRMRHTPDLEKNLVALEFNVVKGKKVYIERVNVYSNSKTRDKVIRRELKISEGDLYNETHIQRSKRRVLSLGFFERADVSVIKGSSKEFMQVNVEVTERSTGSFQIGAGFSSVENFIAQAQITEQNFLGRGQTIGLQAQLSSLRQLVLLRFFDPQFLDTQLTFGANLYNQAQGFGTFTRDALGGSLSLGYNLSWESRFLATYKLERVGVTTGNSGFASFGGVTTPVQAQSVANLYRGGVTSSLRLQVTYDSRNDRVVRPTEGWFNTAFVEIADNFTASENVFFRYGGWLRHYRPLIGPFILRLNGEFGVTTSRDPLGVPIIERYLVGGIFDIRGFAPRSLGPILRVSPPGQVGQPLGRLPLGGNMQLITNTEIEFPIFNEMKIYGVAFFDMGNAFNLEDRYCSGSGGGTLSPKFDPCFDLGTSLTEGLRFSTGFGIRWISPIGPLRFEWGIPLDRQPGEDPVVFEFTIGNFF